MKPLYHHDCENCPLKGKCALHEFNFDEVMIAEPKKNPLVVPSLMGLVFTALSIRWITSQALRLSMWLEWKVIKTAIWIGFKGNRTKVFCSYNEKQEKDVAYR